MWSRIANHVTVKFGHIVLSPFQNFVCLSCHIKEAHFFKYKLARVIWKLKTRKKKPEPRKRSWQFCWTSQQNNCSNRRILLSRWTSCRTCSNALQCFITRLFQMRFKPLLYRTQSSLQTKFYRHCLLIIPDKLIDLPVHLNACHRGWLHTIHVIHNVTTPSFDSCHPFVKSPLP